MRPTDWMNLRPDEWPHTPTVETYERLIDTGAIYPFEVPIRHAHTLLDRYREMRRTAPDHDLGSHE